MDGGNLSIEWNATDNHVYMTGPAVQVFEGEIEIGQPCVHDGTCRTSV